MVPAELVALPAADVFVIHTNMNLKDPHNVCSLSWIHPPVLRSHSHQFQPTPKMMCQYVFWAQDSENKKKTGLGTEDRKQWKVQCATTWTLVHNDLSVFLHTQPCGTPPYRPFFAIARGREGKNWSAGCFPSTTGKHLPKDLLGLALPFQQVLGKLQHIRVPLEVAGRAKALWLAVCREQSQTVSRRGNWP